MSQLGPWLAKHVFQQVDASGLAAFRVLIGLTFALSAGRALANGWVDRFFVAPETMLSFWGFEWIKPAAPWAMHAIFVAIVVLGLLVAAGAFYRVAAATMFVAFTYVELLDVSNYLNHYYLLSLLSLLMVFLPLHRFGSVDAWLSARRSGKPGSVTVSAWVVYLLMFQVGTVYVYAGLAKFNSDWLLHAQPLNIWLSARTDTPLIGSLLDEVWVAYAFSWAGFLHDILIVPALLWARTRVWAFAALVAFHTFTGLLFNIGLFPVIMVCAATIFLQPNWPRAVWRRLRRQGVAAETTMGPETNSNGAKLHPWVVAGVAVWCAVQVLVPLRAHLYGGNVAWHEQGMRWSWRVMVREKNGVVSYRVRVPGRATDRRVEPSQYLTDHQEREMSGQPDLIVQLAHRIAKDFAAKGHNGVEVRVDAWVSLNGRRARRLIDPDVDLTTVILGLATAPWILPGPTEPPPQLQPANLSALAVQRARP